MGKHTLHTPMFPGRIRELLRPGQTEQFVELAMRPLLGTPSKRHRHKGYGSCRTKGRLRMRICDDISEQQSIRSENLLAYPAFPVFRDPPELDDRPEEPDDPPEEPDERPPPPFRFSIARGSSPFNGAAHAISARADSSRMEIATDLGTADDEIAVREATTVAAIFKSFMFVG